MAITLPQRFLKQPQHPAPLDPGHPLFKDIVFAYSAGRGLLDGRHPDKTGAFAGTMQLGYGGGGKYLKTGAPSSHLAFASVDDYNVLGEVTAIALVRHATTTTQGVVIHKCESSGGTNTPFGLLIESSGAVSLNRSNASGSRPFRVWASSATLSVNQLAVIAATQGADMSTAPRFFIDGALDSGPATNLYDGAGSGAPTPTPVSLKLGNRTDHLSRFNGEIYDVLVLRRALSAAEIADLSRNIWAVWQAPARRLWVSANQANNLTGTDSIQGNVAGTGNIAQTQALDATAPTQTNLGSGGTIVASVAVDLAQAAITCGNFVGTAGVTQRHVLPVVSATQSSIWVTNAVGQKHVATAASATQENTSSTGAIARGIGGLLPQALAQANNSGTKLIIQTHLLVSTATGQAHSFSHVSLGGGTTVEIALASPIAAATPVLRKPGIPLGTPIWLKTTIEILTGRRGNRVEVPKFQALSFSATPTKAECEALYRYINSMRHSLEQIIKRLDS
ncbi:Concanavalin A-like lectin/glucanases superfamily protein [Nitrosospira sp. Nsp14]|uniref:LamG-like jellyroll fold domain-containing protein n=1 Tax=Nitrosospira sp. Nsp14 TaxID=1855333 RepID=UPI0008ED53C7|nr:LamG-like jellyroll fold domain-containing protein [Nitrosospira sp. Nsp14]SFH29612.1 Concanavalin A-like lectin/glucanases superfamily protein [Nitrosospira sp. Nsp14]